MRQPKCPSTNEWIKMRYTYKGILFGHKKELSIAISNNMDDLEIIIINENQRKTNI